MTRRALPTRLLLLLLLAGLMGRGLAAPVVSWPSLSTERDRDAGLFGAWSIDQRKVLAALRSLERADPERDVTELKRRVADDPTDLAAADLLGVRYWRRGSFHEAVAQFRRILTVAPACSLSRLALAELFQELGSVDLAEQELIEGVRRAPAALPLRRCLAELYAAEGKHREAAKTWQEIVQARPGDARAHAELAQELFRNGQAEAAKGAIAAAEQRAGRDPELLLAIASIERTLGNLRAATNSWNELRTRGVRSDVTTQLGLLHLYQEEFREALTRFQEAIAEPGAAPVALAGAAVAALGLGDDETVVTFCKRLRSGGHAHLAAVVLANLWLARGDATAIEAVWAALGRDGAAMKGAYDQFLAATKDSPEARRDLALLLGRAEVLRRANWLEQTIEVLQAARKRAPASVELAESLAACLAAVGRADQELAVREELAQLHPDNVRVCQGLIGACLRRHRWAQAEEVNRAFLKRFFNDLESRVTAASLAIWKADYPTAIADCQSTLAMHPSDDRLYNLLLDAQLRSGKLPEAMAAIRNREGAIPTFVPGALERAILAFAGEKLDEALGHAQRGLRQSPRDPRLWFLTGSIIERKGDLPAAMAHYEAIGWLLPDQFAAHLIVARAAARCGSPASGTQAYRSAAALRPDSFELQVEFADALTGWRMGQDAAAFLASLSPATAAERNTVDVRLAEATLAKGDARHALELARAVLARDPADPVARRAAVAACRELDDVGTATQICELASKQGGDARNDADLGLLYLFQQRYKGAEERLASAVEGTEPGAERIEIMKRQAAACIALGLARKAQTTLQAALAARPATAPAERDLPLALAAAGADAEARGSLAALEKAEPMLASWLRGLGSRLAADRPRAGLVLAAYAASAAGWHGRAADLFAMALKQAPDEALLLYDGARSYANPGRPDLGLPLAQKLAAMVPKSGEAHFLVASLLDQQGKGGAALTEYERALGLLGKQQTAERLAIADRLRSAGKVDAAAETYREVLAAEPANLAVQGKLAWLYANHMPDRLGNAETLAAAVAKAQPRDAASRDALGWCRFLNKNPDAARGEVLAAIALEPQTALYYYHLGMIDFVRGQRDRARRALRLALDLDPKLAEGETARSTLKAIEAQEPPGGPLPPAP